MYMLRLKVVISHLRQPYIMRTNAIILAFSDCVQPSKLNPYLIQATKLQSQLQLQWESKIPFENEITTSMSLDI